MAHSPNFPSHYPSSSSSSSSSSSLLLTNAEKTFDGDWHHIFEHSVQEDDPLWKAYIKEAALFDNRMIDEWNKIIDTVLVYRFIGYTVGGLFAAGLVFIFLLTTAAAFIPGCPFHTSASTWMRFLFKLILRHSLPKWIVGAKTSKRTRGLRILGVIIFSGATLIATAFLVLQYSYVFFALIWFPTAAVFWLAGDPPKSDGKPYKYGIHHLLLVGGVVITPLIAFAGSFIDRPPVFIALFGAASIIFAVIATYAIRTYKCIPNTEEAEAVAWLLKSTSSQDPAYFRNAGQIAAGSEHRKALLLSSLLPLLLPLITSRNSHHKEHDLETYVACLAQLSAFTGTEGSFWKNEGAVVHPLLPDTSLLTRLKKLELESPQNSRLRIAARDALRYYGNNATPVQQEYA
ncbi:hypothetical protein GALMADRAFT_217532 [Galerina marginata CBS 339.88]|uniref:Uncharacterized protein n=1 Tax=Galerina marginata (strain CBS 339.88) TaxID=685588 RepID=A0A067S6J1_GALM3|nr:hypothetical protein GALMADRAFT_217532 [Galerina marginata CBS 339.88]